MPVTAKLSRNFYERLGDDIANELVDWFNAVDDTYRMQLRELNELNWNRFQAAMDARFAEFEVKMDRRFAEVDLKMEQRFAEVDLKMEQRFAEVDLKMEQRFSAMQAQLAQFEVRVERRLGDQTKWLIGVWLGTVIPLGGLMVGLFNSIR